MYLDPSTSAWGDLPVGLVVEDLAHPAIHLRFVGAQLREELRITPWRRQGAAFWGFHILQQLTRLGEQCWLSQGGGMKRNASK